MPFRPGQNPPNIDVLLSQLNTSGLSQKNQPLYQIIAQLIRAIQYSLSQLSTAESSGGLADEADLLTWSDESATLPNSRNLLPGTGITFDDSVPNERTIDVSFPAPSADYVVLSDGVVAGPTPVNDGAGNFIYIPYVP